MSWLFTSGSQSIGVSALTSNECSRLISLRIDWLGLLAVQGTLKSLLQHHSSKASIFWHSAFFMVQLSHPYKTTGKTIALTIQTFVGKVVSLLLLLLFFFFFFVFLNTLSTFVKDEARGKCRVHSIPPSPCRIYYGIRQYLANDESL